MVQGLSLIPDDYLILCKEYLKQDIFLHLTIKGHIANLFACHVLWCYTEHIVFIDRNKRIQYFLNSTQCILIIFNTCRACFCSRKIIPSSFYGTWSKLIILTHNAEKLVSKEDPKKKYMMKKRVGSGWIYLALSI